MKFSYRLLKRINPKVPAPKKVAELLTMHLFETEVVGKNTLDIEILPNRYSDAASHWGLVKEIGAITSTSLRHPEFSSGSTKILKQVQNDKTKISLKTPKCSRMIACQLDGIKIKPSPKWMQDVLKDVGMQPINNLVDITNFATLETGQPLHAFDLDKMEGDLVVRSAKKGEEVVSLDNKKYKLDGSDLVLADSKSALDVAGIKGGKKAGVNKSTKRILLTAGNFNGGSIYKTSKKIGLTTNASARFSHQISPELAMIGVNRAVDLIKELCNGQPKALADAYPKKVKPNIHKFDINQFNKITGLNLKEKEAINYLKKLGFKINPNRLVKVPSIRTDIERFEDLVEEVVRLYGHQNLPATPPQVAIGSVKTNEAILFQNKIRTILVSFGLDEVYNYSFVSEKLADDNAVALKNPVSCQLSHLRPSLLPLLLQNIKSNHRFFKRVAIFEIGQVFLSESKEKSKLGIVIADKKSGSKSVFELKGIIDGLLERLGLTDYFFKEDDSGRLLLESSNTLIGYAKDRGNGTAVTELNLDELIKLVREEKSYRPLVKYPSIIRDLSFVVPAKVKFSEVMSIVSSAAPKYLDDIDLLDFYEDERLGVERRSLTLRLLFQSKDRTLTEKEVNQEMKKVTKALINQLNVELR